MEIKTKRCPHCGRVLPVSDFAKNRTKKDGLSIHCKDCTKEYNRKYQEKIKMKNSSESAKEKPVETKSLFNDTLQEIADRMAERKSDLAKIEVKRPVTLKDFQPREIIKHLYDLGYRIKGRDWKLVCITEQNVNLKDIING